MGATKLVAMSLVALLALAPLAGAEIALSQNDNKVVLENGA